MKKRHRLTQARLHLLRMRARDNATAKWGSFEAAYARHSEALTIRLMRGSAEGRKGEAERFRDRREFRRANFPR